VFGQSSYPLVTIVTPAFNSVMYIEETIKSVLRQSYPKVEYIVVDGGSHDGTLSILKRYEDRLKWISEPDQGMYDAVNKGFHLSKGEYLLFLNSDDLLCTDAMEMSVKFLESHKEFSMSYGDFFRMDQKGKVIERVHAGKATFRHLLRFGNTVFSGTMTLRRELLDQVGCMDAGLVGSADYEFCLRVSSQKVIGYIPQALAMFRTHASQLSQTSWNIWQEALSISKKYGGGVYSPLYFRYMLIRLFHFLPFGLVWNPKLIFLRKAMRNLWKIGS
jgi:glycosyltransferase involved in cell wall biosynthesis